MSTEERWTTELGKCPCGAGTISEDVVSPDNAYSKTIRHVTINCRECSEKWELINRTLTLRSSREEWYAQENVLRRVENEIASIKDEVMVDYFTGQNIRSMKAEWEEMKRLGFYKESLATYRNRRGSIATRTVYQFAGMNVDDGWLMGQAGLTNAKTRLEELYKERAETKKAVRSASARIVRKSVDEL